MNNDKIRRIFFTIFLVMFGIYVGIKLPVNPASRFNGNVINDIVSLINNNYVDTVDYDLLQEDAIKGMMNALDPHSMYLPPVEYKEANDELQGNFEGIGIQFRMVQDTLVVLMPLTGGPSEAIGIRAGDRFLKVDGVKIAGNKTNSDDIVKRLKGKKSTKVNVEVLRPGLSKTLKFTITRDVIHTYSVDASFTINNKIGYIKLSKFSVTTGAEIDNSLKIFEKQGIGKVILDLRGNGGGFMSEAVSVADQFLEKGELIVYTEGLHRKRENIYSTRSGRFKGKDVVVIIDEFSASASEIVAGALQDNDRGTIIGRRSFGKGLVQEQMKMRNCAAIRLTVARYHTPTGRCIQKFYNHDIEDYEEEFMNRYTSGELMNQDSIKFDSLQKFTTPKGKIVYGGGGIMPDIYIPYKTDTLQYYYNSIVNKGLLLQYCFSYTDRNRERLERYKDFSKFEKEFVVSNEMLREMVNYSNVHGIKPDERSIAKYGNKMKVLMKAYVARDIFGDNGFFKIYMQIDDDMQKSLEVLYK